MKSEPDAFSWTQQVARDVEPWTGVRSHQARNNLAAMRLGDRALFYHSNIGKEIVGVVEVARAAYPDPTAGSDAKAGHWVCVDMQAKGAFTVPVTLASLKADSRFADLALVRLSRLSVSPVSETHWRLITEMGGWKEPA
ncbi:EVE domain-containing protein [Lichenicoccus sp.]|uniref:EVE domain-containing protein n=1 Tax=Lichenicoccus sp. TaxID=2781899 RepID=UPI003D13E85A